MAKTAPYRKGVGALLFNAAGLVFVGRRVDYPDAWQPPQGGLKKGEDSAEAVLRELAEETGTDKAEILGVSADWLEYDVPPDLAAIAWQGRYRGQRQRWFALRFLGNDRDIDLAASDHPEFDAWRWERLEALPALAIWFKRALYQRLVAEFAEFAKPVQADAAAAVSPLEPCRAES
jgi:putative (di)nucleoside polyphosphate hydrolase